MNPLMNPLVTEAIAACEWGIPAFVLFSTNVFSPLIYYSHLTPVLVSLCFGIYVYLANKKSLLNQALLFITLILSVWLLLDLVLWSTDDPETVLFAWPLVNLFEPFIYAAFVYFTYIFLRGKDVSWRIKLALMLPLLPTILLTPTQWGIVGFDLTNCDREVIEGPVAFYNYIIEIGYVLWILTLAISAWLKRAAQQRLQIVLVVGSILLLLLSFASGNIIGSFSEDWAAGQIGLFGVPLFVGALAYFIVQFRFFTGSQLMTTQLLVIGVWIATASILFIRTIENARLIVLVTLVLLAGIGFLLIRSLRQEDKQRKLIEEQKAQLEIVNNRLRELDKQKSEFVSIASHQLRAPLGAVRGYVSLILEGSFGKPPEALEEPLSRVAESTRNMANTIEDFLNISRIELGRMKYEIVQFDLADTVQTVVNELRPVAEDKGLTISFEKPEPIMVTADSGKVKQVITNLTDNAVKYTEQGSITVSMVKQAGRVQIRIKDTGIGMDEATQNGIFEKFVRGRESRHVNITGTGLGLYIAKQLIEGNKGKVWAESEGKGKGSTFIIELPV